MSVDDPCIFDIIFKWIIFLAGTDVFGIIEIHKTAVKNT